MVSAGELGTDSRFLESELQKILDICHAWGAILLLDEADVFLEKRNMHDIHRNALVSIFLRQLEYFQGILFLTTNRVEVSKAYLAINWWKHSRITYFLTYRPLMMPSNPASTSLCAMTTSTIGLRRLSSRSSLRGFEFSKRSA